jgi:Reverse transcriptase (RNA-dependent DNA polymerase)
VRLTTIRVSLTLALSSGWHIRQLGVHNAFLHGDLKEKIYMQKPPGSANSNYPNHVCLLSKALYDLKHSSHVWFKTLTNFLLSLSFKGSQYDPSLFVMHFNSQTFIILVYLYDIIIIRTNPDFMTTIIQNLQTKFAINDLGVLHYFLDIEVIKIETSLYFSQHEYIIDLLKIMNVQESKPYPSPMVVNQSFSQFDGDPFENLISIPNHC